MRYETEKDFIYLINPPFEMKDDIKNRLSGVWTDNAKRGKGWRFPKNVFVYRELWKNFPELKNDAKFIEDGKQAASDNMFWQNQKNVEKTKDYGLRFYQNADVNYLVNRGSCLVLNEPRTGKTPTMISVIKALRSKRNIIICPSSLVFNWAKEFQKWYPEMNVYPVSGTHGNRVKIYVNFMNQTHRGNKSVLIVSKDTWKTDLPKVDIFDNVKSFDVAVVDEAHFLRNYKSKQSEAIFNLKANIKYALTGTPAVKHGSDVYGLLHFINPDAFPSYWQFTDRYWHIDDNGWGKEIAEPKKFREDELKAIMSINSVQRKRKEVMRWLPSATYQTIPVQLDKKQLKLYEQMLDTFTVSDKETEHEVDTMNVLSQLTRLRQLCLDPRLIGFKEVGAKTTALLEFAEDNMEPFVVMSMFSSYFDLVKPDLEKLGKVVKVIDGSVAKASRTKIVEQFQQGKIDILLVNIIAGGTGITLDKSDTIIFMDKSYSPADNEQAADRIVPTTKERYHPINVITFVASGTVDERVNEILDRKEDLTKIINKPGVLI